VTPTLSGRTVAVAAEPEAQLKLPLPTSTLGRLNVRSIKPATLADGATVSGLLAAITAEDGQLSGLLVADESSYAHAGHPYLGYLLRRLPPGLGDCRIVPVAALLALSPPRAGTPDGPLVVQELAAWRFGGDLLALLDAFFAALFGVHVRLLARYGIALEAHQQNAALVVGPSGPPRLLVRDLDSPLIDHGRLRQALGPAALPPAAFADPRLLTTSPDDLADVFITLVVHLCAGALAFGLERRGVLPASAVLARARRRLTEALDREAASPAAAVLRSRVLESRRLPSKAMVTAGTLVAKSRTGARDINKFYGPPGPNYLRDTANRPAAGPGPAGQDTP
jgi:siderophore synthetase component